MYLDVEDYRPDIQPIGRAISWREGVLISIIVHLIMVIALLLLPRYFPFDSKAARARMLMPEPKEEAPRFVFVQPRIDRPALRPPDRGEASDKDRVARAPERAPKPKDPLPFARGNSPERVETIDRQAARGRGPEPDPAAGRQAEEQRQVDTSQAKLPESQSPLQLPERATTPNGAGGRAATPGGGLGEALRNLQRFVQRENFDNAQGGG